MPLRTPTYLADFDSSTAMVRALGRFLHGQSFPRLGIPPSPLQLLAPVVNHLPQALREQIYIWGGWKEAIPPDHLRQVKAEEIARWVVSCYPRRQYPAVAIGSASGALVHLCAALGIPWLPQTFLIPVRRSEVPLDEPQQDMEWGIQVAPRLLQGNRDLQLHHMYDANQDRLMIRRMTYFRIKRLTLGETYGRFLEEALPAGGTILLAECQLQWPTTQVADRHIFQHGALGGATAEEYQHGSPRVAEYLGRYGSRRDHWEPPPADGARPEAEWGFEPAMRDDVERVADRHGYRIRRMLFPNPELLSPLVADLYRWWYRRRNLPANRLLVESFILMEPWWALRTGSVPFWMTFNKEPSAQLLEQYLNEVALFDELFMMLFSHGADSVGLVPIDRWRAILHRARKRCDFVGVDEDVYPRDFGTFIRYHTEIRKKIAARYPLPGPLALSEVDEFLAENRDGHAVRWGDDRHLPVEVM